MDKSVINACNFATSQVQKIAIHNQDIVIRIHFVQNREKYTNTLTIIL